MKIVIVGDGKVGLAITAGLSKEGHDLTVIDSNPNVLENMDGQYDVMLVTGNGASLPVLREAGVETADLLIAATSADEINILTCIMAKRIGAGQTIARVRNPEYAEQLVMLQEDLGLSMTVNPELAAAREIYHILQFPSFLSRDKFAKGRVEIVELKISDCSPLRDLPLHQLYATMDVRVLVCVVERKGEAFIPNGDFILREGDRIHVTAPADHLVRLVHKLKIETRKVRKVMIVGGSRIAWYLASMLLESGITVKIIERSHDRCLGLAEGLPRASVVQGDGNQQQLLMEEGIQETDALVTLTDLDEANIFLSLYGRHIGVPKNITKISQSEYGSVIEEMGIESVVSPKLLCATAIVRYARAMSNTEGGVITMHGLADGKVDALEFLAGPGTMHLERPLAEIPIRKNFLVACIIRRNKVIIPKGSDCIRQGDSVIIVTSSDYSIVDLNEIFQ